MRDDSALWPQCCAHACCKCTSVSWTTPEVHALWQVLTAQSHSCTLPGPKSGADSDSSQSASVRSGCPGRASLCGCHGIMPLSITLIQDESASHAEADCCLSAHATMSLIEPEDVITDRPAAARPCADDGQTWSSLVVLGRTMRSSQTNFLSACEPACDAAFSAAGVVLDERALSARAIESARSDLSRTGRAVASGPLGWWGRFARVLKSMRRRTLDGWTNN
jgi:hypothetical protein